MCSICENVILKNGKETLLNAEFLYKEKMSDLTTVILVTLVTFRFPLIFFILSMADLKIAILCFNSSMHPLLYKISAPKFVNISLYATVCNSCDLGRVIIRTVANHDCCLAAFNFKSEIKTGAFHFVEQLFHLA